MLNLTDFTLMSLVSIFVIVDPIAAIPTFLAVTEKDSVQKRLRMARLASLATCFILLTCQVCGQQIFKVLGITLPAFQIAGGVILLLVALDMVRAQRTTVKETKEEENEAMAKDDVAITPLAFPMLSGPGAITTVILFASKAQSFVYEAVLAGNILIVSLATFLTLHIVAIRSAMISQIAMKVTSRLMGLLLTAIAFQFILNGIREAHLF